MRSLLLWVVRLVLDLFMSGMSDHSFMISPIYIRQRYRFLSRFALLQKVVRISARILGGICETHYTMVHYCHELFMTSNIYWEIG